MSAADEGYPAGLADLIDPMREEVRLLMARVENAEITAAEWQLKMEELIARYSMAAWMVGADATLLDDFATQFIVDQLKTQYAFLDNFNLVIQSSDEFMAGWYARAEMYANSIVAPYWRGKTKMLPLPTMPGLDSQCLSNCVCGWEITTVDEEKGDYDCFWTLNVQHIAKEHCQTCLERSREWNPLQIRNNELVLIGAI